MPILVQRSNSDTLFGSVDASSSRSVPPKVQDTRLSIWWSAALWCSAALGGFGGKRHLAKQKPQDPTLASPMVLLFSHYVIPLLPSLPISTLTRLLPLPMSPHPTNPPAHPPTSPTITVLLPTPSQHPPLLLSPLPFSSFPPPPSRTPRPVPPFPPFPHPRIYQTHVDVT